MILRVKSASICKQKRVDQYIFKFVFTSNEEIWAKILENC